MKIARHVMALTLLLISFNATAQDAVNRARESFGFKDDSLHNDAPVNQGPFSRAAPPMYFAGFKIYTSLQTDIEINNNILATENAAQSDVIAIAAPQINIHRDWGRHALQINATGNRRQYLENSNENITDMGLEIKADLEPYHSVQMPISLSFNKDHIARSAQRGSTSQSLTINPLQKTTAQAQMGIKYQPNRIYGQISSRYRQVRFENQIRGDGSTLMQSDQDQNITDIETKIGYETKTSFHPFVMLRLTEEDFLRQAHIDGSGFTGDDNSNNVTVARAGLDFDYKGILSGSFGVGRENRNYDQSNIRDTSALSLSQIIKWVPSPKYVLALRSLISTGQDTITQAALKKKKIAFSLDYELQKDLFTRMQAAYAEEDFIAQNRTDKTVSFDSELRYIINPRLQIGAGYTMRNRTSDASNADLNNHIFMLRFIGNL